MARKILCVDDLGEGFCYDGTTEKIDITASGIECADVFPNNPNDCGGAIDAPAYVYNGISSATINNNNFTPLGTIQTALGAIQTVTNNSLTDEMYIMITQRSINTSSVGTGDFKQIQIGASSNLNGAGMTLFMLDRFGTNGNGIPGGSNIDNNYIDNRPPIIAILAPGASYTYQAQIQRQVLNSQTGAGDTGNSICQVIVTGWLK